MEVQPRVLAPPPRHTHFHPHSVLVPANPYLNEGMFIYEPQNLSWNPVHININLCDEFYVHVTVHHNKFLFNKTNGCTNFPNLFCQETLHVSGSSSAHHQEFSTVHSALVYVMRVWWEDLPETCRVSWHNKFWEISASVGFIIKQIIWWNCMDFLTTVLTVWVTEIVAKYGTNNKTVEFCFLIFYYNQLMHNFFIKVYITTVFCVIV
jgi:hypothetical protein